MSTIAHDEPRNAARRPRAPFALDYRVEPNVAQPAPFGWRDVAVIVFILVGPVVIWFLRFSIMS